MVRQPAVVHVAFDNAPDAPRKARSAVAELLSGPDDPVAEAVLLAVSELVSNVVRHSDGGGKLHAWSPGSDGRLRIEVEDHSPAAPVMRDATAAGGRGLPIVDRLADVWGVHPTAHGKVVWAEFSRRT